MNNKLNKFSYVAKNTNGKRVRGTYIAEDEQFVREELSKNNLFVEKIKNEDHDQFASLTVPA